MFFLSWIKYQRRNQSICEAFDIKPIYMHFVWQNKNLAYKVFSTVMKVVLTLRFLSKTEGTIFVQIPSVYLLYTIRIYLMFNPERRIVADCHNNMFYDSKWSRFPFVVHCLSKVDKVVVHNSAVLNYMLNRFKQLKNIIVIKDLVPNIVDDREPILNKNYVFIPCSLGEDEPVYEMFLAIQSSPDIQFVITKDEDHVLSKLPDGFVIPRNLKCTGFLTEPDFNNYLLNCSSVLVLSTRDGTQPSGAVEALAAGKNVILSDLDTTRALFAEIAIFCNNNSKDISEAVNQSMLKMNTDFKNHQNEYQEKSKEAILGIITGE